MAKATKESLLTPHLETEWFTLPSGDEVQLRGMTAFEVHLMTKKANGNSERSDAFVIAAAMVDPKLSEDEALQWMKSRPAGETTAAIARVRDLSGLNDDAPDEAYKSIRQGSAD